MTLITQSNDCSSAKFNTNDITVYHYYEFLQYTGLSSHQAQYKLIAEESGSYSDIRQSIHWSHIYDEYIKWKLQNKMGKKI